MKFRVLLFTLSLKLKRAARANARFKAFIKDRQVKVTIRSGTCGRQFIFDNGRITSRAGVFPGDMAMAWCDADTAFRTMASADEEAVLAALTGRKLAIEGNFRRFAWFSRALDLMMGRP